MKMYTIKKNYISLSLRCRMKKNWIKTNDGCSFRNDALG